MYKYTTDLNFKTAPHITISKESINLSDNWEKKKFKFTE